MQDRYYQTDAVNSIFEYFSENTGNPLVAMPTGTGKSVVIARFCERVFQLWPMQRFLVLTHVKELIEQNAARMQDVWPTAPIGIYSAGLKSRDYIQPIIFGGVASVIKNVQSFGHRDLLIIDEAHLLSDDSASMYQTIIAELRKINPYLKVVGLTATWYRLGMGLLTQGGLFTDICYNICDIPGFAKLIAEGYLVPPIPKKTRTQLDVTNVGLNKGEFNQTQLQTAIDKRDVTYSACAEMCETGQDRRSWLVFCSGIEHAEHVAEQLEAFGVPSAPVHSKMKGAERDRIIQAYKSGEIRAITNNNVLTTGFDDPKTDYIGNLRPTMSPGLWVQMIGRGLRPFENKSNCLVSDFARNTLRLGTIDDPNIPRPKGEGTGEAPVKICDSCGTYNHARVRFCVCCGAEFTFQEKIVRQADTRELISSLSPEVETFNVDRVMYNRHVGKASKVASIKISYLCGLRMFQEFISFDHKNFALHRAHEWWRQRHNDPNIPLSTDLALQRLAELRTPRRIRVWVNKPHPEIIGHEY
jgi:DNA repair protein RadD